MTHAMDILGSVGRALVSGGAMVGRTVAAGYKAIDPDVMRHVAQVPLLSYSLVYSREQEIEPSKPDGYPPLIFVHGLGGNRSNFLPMAWYLAMHGRRRSYRIHFQSGQNFGEMADALAEFVRQVRQVTGDHRVDVVAHSMGGLVARMAIRRGRLSRAVGTLITLGSPHNGTWSARLANTSIARSLRPDSDLIRSINARPLPRSIRAVSLYSDNDLMIVPGECAVLAGSESVDMSPFTHYSYLIDPRSWETVAQYLLEQD